MLMVWENNKCRIESMMLITIMNQVMGVKSRFEEITFTHIYREFNTKVGQLSKGAILM
jgi:hypothetical protein